MLPWPSRDFSKPAILFLEEIAMSIDILVGLPGSGKTSLAKKLRSKNHGIIVSKDTIRYEMIGIEFDKSLEGEVDRIFNAMLSSVLWGAIDNVIIDNTNLTVPIRARLIEKAQAARRNIIAHVMDIDPYTAWERKKSTGSIMSREDFDVLVSI